MCGIVGYTGPREAGPILIEGLRRLEYRGYDSAGIALVDEEGDLFVEKKAGKLANLQDAIARPDAARDDRPRAHPLGHPRPPQRPQRASPPGLHGRDHRHPQRDHRELPRAARRARGARPRAHVRDRHGGDRAPRRGGLPGRPRRRRPRVAAPRRGRLRARRDAQGARSAASSARARTCRSSWGSTARRASSRATSSAILAHTNRVVFLDEGDVADVRPTGVVVTGVDGSPRERPVTIIDWTPEAAEKGGYEHFMLKEIHEQPEALRQSLAGRVTADGRIHAPGGRQPRRDVPDDRRGSSSSPAASASFAALVGRGRDPGLDRAAGAGHGGLGVPLLAAAARREHARHRGHPVGRDGRHDRADAPARASRAARSSRSRTPSAPRSPARRTR